MRKFLIAFAVILFASTQISTACTNFLITKGASKDGSTMVSYSADSHVLYGELYHWGAATYPEGTMMDVKEWDTGKYLGQIKQARQTYNVVGNMNEHQVCIGETTYGGREELATQEGAIMDYGSLIYIALQRSKNAREAIKVITDLVAEYGYYSSGESFSIADPNEVWIMEMIGKGEGEKGAVWVAVKIPDGYISAHANQARITTFPLDNPEECIYSEDVISFAKEKGWYKGKDKNFSFSDTYAPVGFGGARFCEVRVWSFFRSVNSDMDQYLDYAKGHNLENRMPLYIKPDEKICVRQVMNGMRDHLEGTELDMSQDIGAGPFGNPYRWRPLTWEVDGKAYCNERATATQQTGFVFVGQMRSELVNPIGGILWFGVDDADATVFVPMYCSMTKAPKTYERGNGSMMEWSDDAAFWVFNQVTNWSYTRYNAIHPEIDSLQTILEKNFIEEVKFIDQRAEELYKEDPAKCVQYLTDYSCNAGDITVYRWQEFYKYLFMRYMDGNIKAPNPGQQNPLLEQPGYGDDWYRTIIEETGDHFEVKGSAH